MAADNPDLIQYFRFTPTDEFLANPHEGFCTFQRFNGDPLYPGMAWSEEGPVGGLAPGATEKSDIPGFNPKRTAPHYLPTTVAYCRWFWKLLEPRRGEYDFSVIDMALECCRERGQTLAVRLMPFGYVASGQPGLPLWYDDRYPKVSYSDWREKVPDYESKEYFTLWGNLIREFARRYDAHPLLESIDVAFLGPWGEGDGKCGPDQCDRFAALWQEAFARTPRLALIAGDPITGDQLRSSIRRGSGWRADSFGDLRRAGSRPDVALHLEWNHMFNCYPKRLYEAAAADAWKSGPVHFETWHVPMYWFQQGFDLDFILEQGLKYHATYFMPKSTALPEPWLEKLARFCNRIGYRYVLRQTIVSRQAPNRGAFTFKAWIDNVGVAPIYRRYDVAVRLRQGKQEAIVVLEDVDIRSWLPGEVWLDRKVTVPEGFRPGHVELAIGLVDPATKKPGVSFAVKERFGDRWSCAGWIEVV